MIAEVQCISLSHANMDGEIMNNNERGGRERERERERMDGGDGVKAGAKASEREQE